MFATLVGETVGRFINRIRIERAATLLVQQPHRSITDAGVDPGFANPSSFARAFRDTFGMSATEWRNGGYQTSERTPGESSCDVIGSLGVHEGYGIVDFRVDATPPTYDEAVTVALRILRSICPILRAHKRMWPSVLRSLAGSHSVASPL